MAAPQPPGAAPIAVVAGTGSFPEAVCQAILARGGRVFVVALEGFAASALDRHPHVRLRLGQYGAFLSAIRKAGCREVVFVGGVRRPESWRDLVPDLGLIRRLPRVVQLFRGGDDHLLSGVVRITEEAGFAVRGVHEIAPGLVLGPGPFGARAPGAEDLADIARGLAALDALSPYDVGQGLVISGGRVLAIEAAEGTNAMLERVAQLRAGRGGPRRGVFVKAPKRGQNLKVDMPAIGPETIERAAAAGLTGIAARAGGVLTVEPERMLALADAAGLFIHGVGEEGA